MNSRISLRKKLIFWLLFPILILLGVGAVSSYYIADKFAYIAYDRALADSARDLERQISIVDGRMLLDLPPAAERMLLTDEFDTIYFKVTGPDGNLMAGDPGLPAPGIVRNDNAPVMSNGMLHGLRLRIASRYYVPPGSKTGRPVLVQLAETFNKRKILAKEILSALVLPQLALIMAASLALWMGITTGLRPMQRLHDEISARSYHDLSPIEVSYAPVEVLPIIRAVNDLMDRLEKSILSQQRFIADAAHQLRTPIAGIKTQVDLMKEHAEGEGFQHSLKQLNTSTGKLVRLINQMLNLAQVEPDANRAIELKPVNLNELVRKITMEWVPLALKKNIDLGFEGPEGETIIQGDALRIKMLLDNLIDNAVRYSPGSSRITTKLEISGNTTLSVEDNGPGIPLEQRDLVFQRFYRIPFGDTGGSGLGLSIVKEIAGLHAATVIIDEPTGHKGTRVKIIFPA